MKGGPFKLHLYPRDYFDPNPYFDDQPLPPPKKEPIVAKIHSGHFKPPSPPKKVSSPPKTHPFSSFLQIASIHISHSKKRMYF